jgi:hypothetical protein
MSIDPDFCESLIARLCGPLSPPDQIAFREAAQEALSRLGPCWGEGAAYRAVAGLQRTFFKPPSFGRAQWGIEQELRPTKLKSEPAIRHDGGGYAVRRPRGR